VTDPSSGVPDPHRQPGPQGWPPVPPPAQGWPATGYPPPPYPAPAPPGPYPAPRRKSGAGTVIGILVAVLALLLVLCCCGWFTYDGWWVPKQLQEQRKEMISDAGVPAGFYSLGVSEGDDSVGASYKLDCKRGVCPVDVAQSIQAFLSNVGLSITMDRMRYCLGDPGAPSCGAYQWKRDGFTMSAMIVNAPGNRSVDGTVTVTLSVGWHD
jgi:hypothetical protein